MGKKTKIIPGMTFNRWTILHKVVDPISGKKVGWFCKCACGTGKIIPNVSTVINGDSTSCGCFRSANLKVINPMFDPEIKRKMSENHKADPNRKQILDDARLLTHTNEANAKRVATNNERYGGNTPASSSIVLEKMAATNHVRYGGVAPAVNKTILRKMKDTTEERYGVDNIMKSEHHKEQVLAAADKTRREKGLQHLSNGEVLVDYAKKHDHLPTTLRNIKRLRGEEELNRYINKPQDKSKSALERYTLKIFQDAGYDVKIHNKTAPLFLNTEYKYRPDFIINNKGSDLYVESDGLYYHDVEKKGKRYHYDKCEAYLSKGSYVYQLRSDEIYYKTDIVASMIGGKLGLNKSIGARECTIKTVSQDVANEFLTRSHLMGQISAKHLGLFYNDELVCLMSYKMFKGGILDISRFCTKLNTHVSGGFSRLLSHIEKNTKCSAIRSFVDRRYATGESLIKCGFKLESITLGWQWSDKDVTFNRLHCRANMDERGLTEAQHAKELKLIKIYDAGQAKFIKQISKVPPPKAVE